MSSVIRVNSITNQSGLGTVTLSNTGVVIAGITTISDLRTTGGTLTVGTGASIFSPATNVLTLGTGSSERARIDSSGRLLVGVMTARTGFFDGVVNPLLQVEGSTSGDCSLSVTRNSNDADGPRFILGRSRGTGNTIVQSGDRIGGLTYQGNDGAKFVRAAEIECYADSAVGVNSMPGRLVFSTTAAGASIPTERMRINQSGTVTFSNYGSIPITFVTGTQSTNVTHDRIQFNANTGAYYVINQNAVGVRLDNGTQSWAAQSDERLKTGLNSFNDALAKVSTFRAGTGRFLTDDESVSRSFLIAQDVQKVLPEAVSVDNDEMGTLYLRYTELIPLLVAALKESKGRIETLETKVAALESQ
jgi:hypothetical protein